MGVERPKNARQVPIVTNNVTSRNCHVDSVKNTVSCLSLSDEFILCIQSNTLDWKIKQYVLNFSTYHSFQRVIELVLFSYCSFVES